MTDKIEVPRELLEGLVETINRSDTSEGYCCCGDSMGAHGSPMDYGHSPVDAGEYYAGQLVDKVKTILREAAKEAVTPAPNDPAVAAIEYALHNDSPKEFLRCWMYGEFDTIRKEWENVPDEVFIGADHTFTPAAHTDNEGEPLPSTPDGLEAMRRDVESWHWIVQRYGSPPDKGWNIWAGRYPEQCTGRAHIACLGDGDEAEQIARQICEAHNAAIAAEKREG